MSNAKEETCRWCGESAGYHSEVPEDHDFVAGPTYDQLSAALRAAEERNGLMEKLLRNVVVEADFVLSGGDDPHDRCTERGHAGVGMLRGALRPARAALTPPPKDKL